MYLADKDSRDEEKSFAMIFFRYFGATILEDLKLWGYCDKLKLISD